MSSSSNGRVHRRGESKKLLSVWVSPQVHSAVHELAVMSDTSQSAVLREALTDYAQSLRTEVPSDQESSE